MTTVLVTRPALQADGLCTLLAAQGFVAERLPLLEIVPVKVNVSQLRLLKQWPGIDWFIFISANAVNFALTLNGGRIHDYLGNSRVAAVGEATAKALQLAGLVVDAVPKQGFNSEALLAMPELQVMQGQRCIIVRGIGGREALATILYERGAQVDYLEVYERRQPNHDSTWIIHLLQTKALHVITLSSAEALQNLLRLLPSASLRETLFTIPLVVISERLAQLAQKEGFRQVLVSDGVSDSAVVKKIIDLVSGDNSG